MLRSIFTLSLFGWRGFQEARMCKLALIAALLVIAGSGSLDKNGTGIKDGHAYYENKDYGPYGENAFRAALGDQWPNRPPDAIARARASGTCYCWVKRTEYPKLDKDYSWWADWVPGELGQKYRAEAQNGAIADRIPAASARCRPITGAHADADEVAFIDAAMYLADRTMCPTGYPNPITQEPSQSTPAPHTGEPSIIGKWQSARPLQGSAQILEFRVDGTMRATVPGVRGVADPKIRDREYVGSYKFDGQALTYTYLSCTNVNRSIDSGEVVDTSGCPVAGPPRNVTRLSVLSLSDKELVLESTVAPPSIVYKRIE